MHIINRTEIYMSFAKLSCCVSRTIQENIFACIIKFKLIKNKENKIMPKFHCKVEKMCVLFYFILGQTGKKNAASVNAVKCSAYATQDDG